MVQVAPVEVFNDSVVIAPFFCTTPVFYVWGMWT